MYQDKTIRELRRLTGLSQVKFAEKFRVNLRTLQSWEQGWARPSGASHYMIARILELEDQLSKSRRCAASGAENDMEGNDST